MKIKLLTLFVIISLWVAACNSTPSQEVTLPGTPAPGNVNQVLPETTQLLLGIFNLDGTDAAVTVEQAKELLPLVQALNTMSSSQSAVKVEIDAVYAQLWDTLTTQQADAIRAMNLTNQDFSEVAQAQGWELNTGFRFGSNGTLTPELQSTMEARRASGNFPQGGPGGGEGGGFVFRGGGEGGVDVGGFGGGAPGGIPFTGGANTTPVPGIQATRQASAVTMLDRVLLGQLVTYLEALK
jgi:hypothetical protein